MNATCQSQTATVIISLCKFDTSAHEISCTNFQPLVDGQRVLGLGLGSVELFENILNSSEWIADFSVKWNDDDPISIPPDLFFGCFNPLSGRGPQKFEKKVRRHFHVEIGAEQNTVFIFLQAGDAATHYDVLWVVGRDGTCSRLVNANHDVSFIDMDFMNMVPNGRLCFPKTMDISQ